MKPLENCALAHTVRVSIEILIYTYTHPVRLFSNTEEQKERKLVQINNKNIWNVCYQSISQLSHPYPCLLLSVFCLIYVRIVYIERLKITVSNIHNLFVLALFLLLHIDNICLKLNLTYETYFSILLIITQITRLRLIYNLNHSTEF